jgi:hypothetical protein
MRAVPFFLRCVTAPLCVTCCCCCCCRLQSVPEEGRRQLLDEAARWVTDHLFGQHSTESKVGNPAHAVFLEGVGMLLVLDSYGSWTLLHACAAGCVAGDRPPVCAAQQ